ncbi:MAG: adenine-specific methyltransferase EcoRI family protein [Bacteroidales bacterium]|nr:adenine-specific methyltransferase EcoRI family protein [Bacteroidales bacterium]MDD2205129.1 adenine-specific methyltransferase EcoRI family protein [Bacteroidales bacterium]MDD3151487.1 adenine-specific methyltransferase EcoRI family protein [Bacteroidales bacterium]MDD3914900.1 adenine-specific methyltransferase EcoRI family protein [Bacteroidales bacterium]MDD4634685.1 adenine-specific methyltransferase EcoRI family protein [Bacteroidales bacterium]
MANKDLTKARNAKNDEFYTRLEDIENELRHYTGHFKDKTIFCNCDDPRISSFFHYFSYNFEYLGLKKLITTCYKNHEIDLFSQNDSERAIYLEYNGDKNGSRVPDIEEIGVNYLQGNGDFRRNECIELLKQSDIVVTNPPFSLFREYVEQLFKYDKKFIIIGSLNAITYKEIFSLIKSNLIWLGYGFKAGNAFFRIPEIRNFAKGVYDKETGLVKFRNCCWFTNLDIQKRHDDLILYKQYIPKEYPKYDNYNAINVDKTADIPMDYDEVMGVPITFLDKYNPEQFEIVKFRKGDDDKDLSINGKCPYFRILIRRIKK